MFWLIYMHVILCTWKPLSMHIAWTLVTVHAICWALTNQQQMSVYLELGQLFCPLILSLSRPFHQVCMQEMALMVLYTLSPQIFFKSPILFAKISLVFLTSCLYHKHRTSKLLILNGYGSNLLVDSFDLYIRNSIHMYQKRMLGGHSQCTCSFFSSN